MFDIRCQSHAGAASLHLSGEFDLTCKRQFEARLAEATSAKPREVVLDLRELEFIDSTGLSLVLEAWSNSRRRGFELAVILPDDESRVRGVFRQTGLDDALPIVDSHPLVPARD